MEPIASLGIRAPFATVGTTAWYAMMGMSEHELENMGIIDGAARYAVGTSLPPKVVQPLDIYRCTLRCPRPPFVPAFHLLVSWLSVLSQCGHFTMYAREVG